MEEWDNIPDVADIGHKFKRKKLEKFTPVPDSVLSAGASKGTVSLPNSKTHPHHYIFFSQFHSLRLLSKGV
jgi:hypothetical protein